MLKPKTAYDLKAFVEAAGHESHFFTRSTMKFFGDTMRNYGMRGPVTVVTPSGESVQCYELYRRHPVKCGVKDSAYFDANSYKRVFPAR
jgi:hypothetical protein